MLSRTADNLYWIGRYLERAETSARLLDVGGRNALLPNIGEGYRNEWDAVLAASGTAQAFTEKYSEPVQRNIETHMFFDRENPSSITSCLTAARENARIVRTALTTRVWDALNMSFQELKELQRTPRSELPLPTLTEWTMRQTMLIRGAIESTLLRNDGHCFFRVGASLERADNTARLMDVKYYVLLPSVGYVGSELDTYQWTTLLRAMSAHRSFHWAYGGEITPSKIVHFMTLNSASPRSILTSVDDACRQLETLARAYGKTTEAQTAVRTLVAELAEAITEDIFDEGLHEFLTRMILAIGGIGAAVQAAYLSGEAR